MSQLEALIFIAHLRIGDVRQQQYITGRGALAASDAQTLSSNSQIKTIGSRLHGPFNNRRQLNWLIHRQRVVIKHSLYSTWIERASFNQQDAAQQKRRYNQPSRSSAFLTKHKDNRKEEQQRNSHRED